jgi:predicted TIM-barrel fold metal-dependent hydrolase
MDEAGISQAVVMGRQAGPKYGCVSNDDVAELGELHPGRFHLFGGVSLNDVPAAVAEVERVVGTMSFKGIAVDGGWSEPPVYIDDEVLYPIYEKCQELETILSLSMSIFLGPDLSYVEPIRLQHVAADFPDLLIVVPHGGWPYVMEFLGVAFMYRNVWLAPDFYVYIPGMPGASQFVEAANFFLADRFLFASSYPERPLKQTVEEFKRLPFKPDVLEKALHKNAEWILGDREPWPEH